MVAAVSGLSPVIMIGLNPHLPQFGNTAADSLFENIFEPDYAKNFLILRQPKEALNLLWKYLLLFFATSSAICTPLPQQIL